MNGGSRQEADLTGRDTIPLNITYMMNVPSSNTTSYDMRIEGNVYYHNPSISSVKVYKSRFSAIVRFLDLSAIYQSEV